MIGALQEHEHESHHQIIKEKTNSHLRHKYEKKNKSAPVIKPFKFVDQSLV